MFVCACVVFSKIQKNTLHYELLELKRTITIQSYTKQTAYLNKASPTPAAVKIPFFFEVRKATGDYELRQFPSSSWKYDARNAYGGKFCFENCYIHNNLYFVPCQNVLSEKKTKIKFNISKTFLNEFKESLKIILYDEIRN